MAADLKSVMAGLEKSYKGTITRLGEIKVPDSISTGSLLIDTITGIGGLAKGRVHEFGGKESTGKCVDLDTMILTRSGYLKMRELIEETKWDEVKEGEAVELNVLVRGERNRILSTSHAYKAGKHDSVRVETFDGHILTGKPDHRIKVLGKEGLVKWVMLDELDQKDVVILQIGAKAAALSGGMKEETEKVRRAMVAALFGATRKMDDGTSLKIIDQKFFSPAVKLLQHDWDVDQVSVTDFSEMTGEIQLDDSVEDYIEKERLRVEIPRFVRTGSREVQITYLATLFKARAFGHGGKVEVVLYSESLTQQVQLLAENWGMSCSWFATLDQNGKPEYKLYVNTMEGMKVFGSIVGDEKWQDHEKVVGAVETVPNQKGNIERVVVALGNVGIPTQVLERFLKVEEVTKANLQTLYMKLREHLRAPEFLEIKETWDLLLDPSTKLSEVIKIQWGAPVEMGDLTVPNVELYQTAGFISHNSTLALCCGVQALNSAVNDQNVVLYLDYEHALSPSLALKLGMPDDPEKFIWVRPDSAEEGFEIFWKLHETGRLALCVIDSYAAMTPKARIDSQSGGEKGVAIGLRSKLAVEFIETATKKISHTGTTLIVCDQYRAQISMTGRVGIYSQQNMQQWRIPEWFTPISEDTAGSRAIKHYYTTRIRLDMVKPLMAKRVSPVTGKEESTPVGNVLNVIVVKNKLADPYQRGKVTLEYGKGYDNMGCLIEIAKTKGVIPMTAQGHWEYNLGSQLLKGRGGDQLEKELRENTRFLESVVKSSGLMTTGNREKMFPQLSAEVVSVGRSVIESADDEADDNAAKITIAQSLESGMEGEDGSERPTGN